MRNRISLTCAKNQEEVKALLNGVDVGNVEYCMQMLSAWVDGKLKLWDNFNYGIWETIKMQSLMELHNGPAILLNVNTCKSFGTC